MTEIDKNDQVTDQKQVYSKAVRAGKRTYFLDVRTTRDNDYFLTITESKKRHYDGAFVKRKIFLYKEDFNKFVEALTETVNHIKSELMPGYDFDKFSHKKEENTVNEVKESTSNTSVKKNHESESNELIEHAETLDSNLSFGSAENKSSSL